MKEIANGADILINNSGGPHGGPLIDAEENEFRVAFERLLICNQIMTKAVVPGMKEKGSGRIINIISISVNQVIPDLGVSNTVRGAVAQWAKTLALELGQYGITVNNILPGYTATNRLHDLAKMVFAFSLLWAYMGYSQYLVIWYADLPEETPFLLFVQ